MGVWMEGPKKNKRKKEVHTTGREKITHTY